MKRFFKGLISVVIAVALIIPTGLIFNTKPASAAPVFNQNILKGASMSSAGDIAFFEKATSITTLGISNGGMCGTNADSIYSFSQAIDLNEYAGAIDSGSLKVNFGAEVKGSDMGAILMYISESKYCDFANELKIYDNDLTNVGSNWGNRDYTVTIPATYYYTPFTRKVRYLHIFFQGLRNNTNNQVVRTYWRNGYVKIIDSNAPTYLTTTTNTSTSEKYKAGSIINYVTTFSEAINWSGATITPTFDVGGTKFTDYTKGEPSEDGKSINFSFTVPSTGGVGDDVQVKLESIAYNVSDLAGNAAAATQTPNITHSVDNKLPTITELTDDLGSNRSLKTADKLQFAMQFSEPIQATPNGEKPYIELDSKYKATYLRTDSNSQAVFEYTVKDADSSADLQITSINLEGITDNNGNLASYQPSDYNNKLVGRNIKIDNLAPTIEPLAYDGAYVNKDYSLSIAVTDAVSGIKSVSYAWVKDSELPNYTQCQGTTSPFNINLPTSPTNSDYTLYIKAEDNASNSKEYPYPTKFKFDFVKPQISMTPTYYDKTVFLKKMVVNVSDVLSGIATIADKNDFEYIWKDLLGASVLNDFAKSGVEIKIPTAPNIYSLTIKASDNAGNKETQTQNNIQIADLNPSTTFAPEKNSVFKKKHSLDITVKGSTLGIKEYYFIMNQTQASPEEADSAWQITSQTTFSTPTNGNGDYYLHIKAVDNSGNIKIQSSGAFSVDNTKPTISINPDGNSTDPNKLEYDVAVTITDDKSSLANITRKYAVTTTSSFPLESTLKDFTGNTVTVDDVKVDKYLHILAVDQAENKVSYTSPVFASDKTPPTGTIEKTTASVYYTNKNTHTLTINASDNSNVVPQMKLKIDSVEGEWQTLTNQKEISFAQTGGEHSIAVKFKDQADNETDYLEPVKYYYDVTNPEIQITYNPNSLTNKDVIATATATDNSGNSNVEFISKSSHTLSSNSDTYVFTVEDKAGNQATKTAQVDYIDKTNPTISFVTEDADNKPHKDVSVTINAEDSNDIQALRYRFVKQGETAGDYIACANGSTVKLDKTDGNYKLEAEATDKAGNVFSTQSNLLILDNTPPVPTISYNPPSRTAKNVEATISFNEDATVTNNGKSNKYIFTDNDTVGFKFEFADTAGNTNTATAKVDWIDRTKPTARVELSNNGQWTSDNVTVKIIATASGTEIRNVKFNGEELTNETVESQGNNTYLVKEYGTISYEIFDIVTEVTGTDSSLIKIDRTIPSITQTTYSNEEWTNQNVVVTIEATDNSNENVNYTNGKSHTFTENGTHTFKVTDSAGNELSYNVTVDNIDKSTPIPTVTYYVDDQEFDISNPINKDITAKVTFDDGGSPITITNNDGKAEYVFDANSNTTIQFADKAGNSASVPIGVNNIDKNPPKGEIKYSNLGWTNQTVMATLTATDAENEVTITSQGGATHAFSENGSFDFVFKDAAGNSVTKTATITKIDKKPPVVSHELSIDTPTYFSVVGTIKNSDAQDTLDNNDTIIVTNNKGLNYRQFNSNGTFAFEIKDVAGNTATYNVVVNNILSNATPVSITYSKTEPTNEDVVATIVPTNPNDLIFISNNGGSNKHTFTENGEFEFTYTNPGGIVGTASANVANIVKEKPVLTVTYSRDTVGKEPVMAQINSKTPVTYSYMAPNGTYEFKSNSKVLITATDAVGNSTDIVLETNLIDNTPPKIIFDKQSECVTVGGKFDKNAGVKVSDDTMENLTFQVTGNVNTAKEGDYTLTYTATDLAGNTVTALKNVTVYSPLKGLVLAANGTVLIGEETLLHDQKVKIEVLTNNKDVKIKILPNKRAVGEFKTNGEIVTDEYTFKENGYYTIYAIDGERNYKTSIVFVQFN